MRGSRRTHASARERARRVFGLAGRFAWRSADPVVIACAGLSGTGKSAVAALVSDATGFPVVSSDVVRREPSEPDPSYDPASRRHVYDRIRGKVERRSRAREPRGRRDVLASFERDCLRT
jgi:adenylylsulfate kinase-like enzyme